MNNTRNQTSKYLHKKLNIYTEVRSIVSEEKEYLDNAQKLIQNTNPNIKIGIHLQKFF